MRQFYGNELDIISFHNKYESNKPKHNTLNKSVSNFYGIVDEEHIHAKEFLSLSINPFPARLQS